MSPTPVSPAGWPPYILERAAQAPPPDCRVIPGTTPVVSFGHPLQPEVATLGINPSSAEFIGGSGLLEGEDRRLATLGSVGVNRHSKIDPSAASRIVDDCANYFNRRPYRRWFGPLDRILKDALGVSYYDQTACHLDLVQWATDPLWGELSAHMQARLLSSDRAFLMKQLRHEGYRTVLVNGRTALVWVQKAGLVRWKEAARLQGQPAAMFYVGDTDVPRFVAWSCNLQSQPGAMRHIDQLVSLVKEHGLRHSGGAVPLSDPTLIPKGTHFRSREELVDFLGSWLADNKAIATIGDVSRFARAPWISVETPFGLMDINADTKREAVERLVLASNERPLKWVVRANNRRRFNKVAFAINDNAHGWYAYLRKPLTQEEEF